MVNTLQSYLNKLDDYFKQADLSSAINISLTQDPKTELFGIIALVAQVLLLIVVLVILSKVRNRNKIKDDFSEEA
ncbi:MAG: hypothetical protein IKX76_05790, partial [Eubacterium sp.]|nr:hypothetical protein [Eubacterium sp.]